MLRTILVYGAIAGTIVIISILLGLSASEGGTFFSSEVFGYLVMLIAMSMIFMGIKRYRDVEKGGVIRFLPALGVGLGIAAVAGVMYVLVWELYLYSTDYAFIHEYTAGLVEAAKEKAMSDAELNTVVQEMEQMAANYARPLFRVGITFLEIFPVGLLIALISSAVLRNPKILPART